ncbi:hypothetical protein EAS64_14245 [Trebonia kvetii]|uniref:Uncharacterized protein n=1 Tax=Trebonia kvetii TaxID=2480626 RepID=A0A6P2C3Y7_9ACTN|nr:hypothetical protein [Trebonia kvetii]TVZ05657.1 hypothetical protein EAS64_14245 [Trebonia kvetii]
MGSVALANPLQYASFVAIPKGHFHGSVVYTNFTYAASGTNVWNISGANAITFNANGTDYQHSLNVTSLTATSNHSTRFSGTGAYGTQYTWGIEGSVNWNRVKFTIKYNNSPYSVTGHGSIGSNGSVQGTATDSNNAALTFSMPVGSAYSVLNYRAPVTWASVKYHSAAFTFTIPNTAPAGLAGLNILVNVHAGGANSGGSWAHGVAPGPVTNYPITSGHIRIFG